MKTYKEWSPSQFDTKGLGNPEYQDWLVAPVIQTRDSGVLEQSNFRVIQKDLFSTNSEEYEYNNARMLDFNHWGCGWLEIIVVRPGSEAEKKAQEWENALSDYPIADETDYAQLEHEAICNLWGDASIKERLGILKESESSLNYMCVRRDDLPVCEKIYSYMVENYEN